MGAEAPDLKCRPRTNSTAKSYRGDHHAWRCTGSTTSKKRVEIERAAFAFDKRRRDRGAVMMEIVPVAIERVIAEAIYSLVDRFSGRETGSMITLEAVLPEAVAAEFVTSEAVPEEATLPEAMAAKAAVPEAGGNGRGTYRKHHTKSGEGLVEKCTSCGWHRFGPFFKML